MKAIILIICILSGQAAGQVKTNRAHNLEEIRAALKSGGDVDIGSVHVGAAKLVMQVSVSHDRVLMAVKGSSGGALALFKSDGELADAVKVGSVISYQVLDLDEDDVSGIVTDEVEGAGTGILLRQFRLYSLAATDHVTEIWHAPSFSRKAPWSSTEPEPPVKTERGYLAFNRAGAGYPAQMFYALCDAQGH